MKKYTKKAYEQYLNDMSDCVREEDFIMCGKMRHGKYGTMLRKYDPIGFEIGFNEWKREHNGAI